MVKDYKENEKQGQTGRKYSQTGRKLQSYEQPQFIHKISERRTQIQELLGIYQLDSLYQKQSSQEKKEHFYSNEVRIKLYQDARDFIIQFREQKQNKFSQQLILQQLKESQQQQSIKVSENILQCFHQLSEKFLDVSIKNIANIENVEFEMKDIKLQQITEEKTENQPAFLFAFIVSYLAKHVSKGNFENIYELFYDILAQILKKQQAYQSPIQFIDFVEKNQEIQQNAFQKFSRKRVQYLLNLILEDKKRKKRINNSLTNNYNPLYEMFFDAEEGITGKDLAFVLKNNQRDQQEVEYQFIRDIMDLILKYVKYWL